MRVIIAIVLACVAQSAIATPWDSYNQPSHMDSAGTFSYVLSAFAAQATTPVQPWSDTYWPSMESGIAHRWNSDTPKDFNYHLNTLAELKNMSQADIATLSPAEKFDIYVGRYDYPTVNAEWSRTGPNDPSWEGLCHGWAPASLYYTQPNPTNMTNKDGIVIPFGSSDIKALLTYKVGEYDDSQSDTAFIAERCNYDLQADPSKENSSACADMNAGAFYVTIANWVGAQQKGFVLDRDRSIQVWNQPVFTYTTSVSEFHEPAPTASRDTVKSATVNMQIGYGKETYPNWNAHPTNVVTENYQFTVDVDANGNVVGGTHITWDRPDFAWMVTVLPFSGFLAPLQQVYQSSTGGNSSQPHLMAVAPRTVSHMPNHAFLTEMSGQFGIKNYPSAHRASWTIAPEGGAKSIVIMFTAFDTERFHDKVRIFEGAHGEGALIAVLHGSQIPQPVRVHASAVLVTFKSDRDVNGAGFQAVYTVSA